MAFVVMIRCVCVCVCVSAFVCVCVFLCLYLYVCVRVCCVGVQIALVFRIIFFLRFYIVPFYLYPSLHTGVY